MPGVSRRGTRSPLTLEWIIKCEDAHGESTPRSNGGKGEDSCPSEQADLFWSHGLRLWLHRGPISAEDELVCLAQRHLQQVWGERRRRDDLEG